LEERISKDKNEDENPVITAKEGRKKKRMQKLRKLLTDKRVKTSEEQKEEEDPCAVCLCKSSGS